MNQLLSDIAARGIRIDGQAFSTTFVTGQLFSLDGVHLTGKGYAIVANHIIKAVNAKYNANIPQAIVHDYTGIEFP
jgi:lysophospholipase L1-like esterase